MQDLRILLVMEDMARAFARMADNEYPETCTVQFPDDIKGIIHADNRRGTVSYEVILGERSRKGPGIIFQEHTLG